MATASTEPRLTLHLYDRRVRIVIDGTLIADTTRAIELRERAYPPRHCNPRDDVSWSYERPVARMEEIAGRLVFYKSEAE